MHVKAAPTIMRVEPADALRRTAIEAASATAVTIENCSPTFVPPCIAIATINGTWSQSKRTKKCATFSRNRMTSGISPTRIAAQVIFFAP
jgi:hypothetical protein